jgi:hypothetical protein
MRSTWLYAKAGTLVDMTVPQDCLNKIRVSVYAFVLGILGPGGRGHDFYNTFAEKNWGKLAILNHNIANSHAKSIITMVFQKMPIFSPKKCKNC